MTVIEKLQSLLNAANEKTAASDTNLTAAISTLIAGYGGGMPVGISAGEFTVVADTTEVAPIAYGLDKFPNYLFIYAKNKSVEATTATHIRCAYRSMVGVFWDESSGYYDAERNNMLEMKDSTTTSINNNAIVASFPEVGTDNDTYIDAPVSTWTYRGGVTYGWIAIRVEA